MTFRTVAAEAEISVRLVQYYFGAKCSLHLTVRPVRAARAAASRCVVSAAVVRVRSFADLDFGPVAPTAPLFL
ncbi:hypothetical protein OHB26_34750 [Nocardia sp. NBC_01503]|uniref:hypothetical protein n=1 Tax=Nocardia sp. NBC_01503 TaxID=2975997 RepID=UPI002E7C29CD|nr:hypothetical protein [Nocardia sp. NBC_01503]WTL32003.1 hypothetical protein OHB26_34750 [Nocardia sp. NBC_01503]